MARKSHRERLAQKENAKAELLALEFRSLLSRMGPRDHSFGFHGFKVTPQSLMGNTFSNTFAYGHGYARKGEKYQKPGSY